MEPSRPILVIDTAKREGPSIEDFRMELLRVGLDPEEWLKALDPVARDTVDLVVSGTHGHNAPANAPGLNRKQRRAARKGRSR